MKQFLLLFLVATSLTTKAQNFYDPATIQTLEITFAESNWDQLLDNAYASTGDYILAQSIALDGFHLTDDIDDLTKWAFPGGTSIDANGYLMIWADGDTDQDGLHADFGLSAGGETLILVDADGKLVDTITYADQVTDVSHGRFPNGTGDFKDMTPTFNAENNDGIVSIRYEALVGAELTLFPNPTSGLINVRLERAYPDDLQFRLFATDGRLLRETELIRGSTTLMINANGLPEGFYWLSVADGRAVDTHKVIVRR